MAVTDLAAGYPVHSVASYHIRTTGHGVTLTDWVATCGATGQKVGRENLGNAQSARSAELCKTCWPSGHATYHPRPIRTVDK